MIRQVHNKPRRVKDFKLPLVKHEIKRSFSPDKPVILNKATSHCWHTELCDSDY